MAFGHGSGRSLAAHLSFTLSASAGRVSRRQMSKLLRTFAQDIAVRVWSRAASSSCSYAAVLSRVPSSAKEQILRRDALSLASTNSVIELALF